MSAPLSEIKKYLKEALVKPSGIIIVTPDYIYALYEMAPNRWRQISYVFADNEGYIDDVDTKRALLLLMEEVSKSLIRYNKGEWRTILSEAELDEILEKIEK